MGGCRVTLIWYGYTYCDDTVDACHLCLISFWWRIHSKTKKQCQTPSLDKREGLRCGNAVTTFCKPLFTFRSSRLTRTQLERSILYHQCANPYSLFVSFVLRNWSADLMGGMSHWIFMRRWKIVPSRSRWCRFECLVRRNGGWTWFVPPWTDTQSDVVFPETQSSKQGS